MSLSCTFLICKTTGKERKFTVLNWVPAVYDWYWFYFVEVASLFYQMLHVLVWGLLFWVWWGFFGFVFVFSKRGGKYFCYSHSGKGCRAETFLSQSIPVCSPPSSLIPPSPSALCPQTFPCALRPVSLLPIGISSVVAYTITKSLFSTCWSCAGKRNDGFSWCAAWNKNLLAPQRNQHFWQQLKSSQVVLKCKINVEKQREVEGPWFSFFI